MKKDTFKSGWRIVGIVMIILGLISTVFTYDRAQRHYEDIVMRSLRFARDPVYPYGPSIEGRQLRQLELMNRAEGAPDPGEFPEREALYYHRWYLAGMFLIVFGAGILYLENLARRMIVIGVREK